jgi:hypothetical protein
LERVTPPSQTDYERWHWAASRYLERGYWKEAPTSLSEASLTAHDQETTLLYLQDSQRLQLEAFLSDNRAVLNDLAQQLFRVGRLDKEQVLPFLRRVVLPENFPVLK